ncbi:LysR family transcriptional regulator [Pseudomonas sp. dw_358]|uniref:LysR family transcriptional regulator n=1 Tax=Pseudomonas sp. dw_358 TaxID=2720083 RepID=UPI001BD60830|nr:LysR family transcriptional regulator [Pseudomonas sp. dw_358]
MPQTLHTLPPSKIDLQIFAEIDLNLMVVFMVIYEERNVSRAALKLGVGQPAVSGSLARLRKRFDDRLFERVGNRMQPTAKADEMAVELAPAIRAIESVLSRC